MTDAAIRQAADWMQVIDLILAVLLFAVAVWAMRRWRQARALLWGIISVALFGTAFHAATLLNLIPSPLVNLISATQRAYIYAFLLATLLTMILVALSPGLDGDDE